MADLLANPTRGRALCDVLTDRLGFTREMVHRYGSLPGDRWALLAVCEHYLFAWESPSGVARDFSYEGRRLRIANAPPAVPREEAVAMLDFLLKGLTWREVVERADSRKLEVARRQCEIDDDIERAGQAEPLS